MICWTTVDGEVRCGTMGSFYNFLNSLLGGLHLRSVTFTCISLSCSVLSLALFPSLSVAFPTYSHSNFLPLLMIPPPLRWKRKIKRGWSHTLVMPFPCEIAFFCGGGSVHISQWWFLHSASRGVRGLSWILTENVLELLKAKPVNVWGPLQTVVSGVPPSHASPHSL